MLEPPSRTIASMRFSDIKRRALSRRARRSPEVIGVTRPVIGVSAPIEGGTLSALCASASPAATASAPALIAAEPLRNVRRLHVFRMTDYLSEPPDPPDPLDPTDSTRVRGRC